MDEYSLCKLIFGTEWEYYMNDSYIVMLDLGTEHVRVKNEQKEKLKVIRHSFLPEMIVIFGKEHEQFIINTAPVNSGSFIDIPYMIYPKHGIAGSVCGYSDKIMNVELYRMNERSSIIKTENGSYFAFNRPESIKDLLQVFYDESLYDNLIIGIIKQKNYKMKKIIDKKFIDNSADIYELVMSRNSTPKLNIVIRDESLLIKSRNYVIDKINSYNLDLSTHERLGTLYQKTEITRISDSSKYLAVTNKPYDQTEYILFDNYAELMMHIVPNPDWFNIVFTYNNEISPIKLPITRIYPYSVIVGFKYSLSNMLSLMLQIRHLYSCPFKMWMRLPEEDEWDEPYNQYNFIMGSYKIEYDEDDQEFKPNKYIMPTAVKYPLLPKDSNYFNACLDIIRALGFTLEISTTMLVIGYGELYCSHQLVNSQNDLSSAAELNII